MAKTEITRADIMALDEYEKVRREKRTEITALKRNRRVHVGPFATFYFESYATMWRQIHEMLFIEKGGEEQIEDELRAYNPLIPKGEELVATVMFEIEDETRRNAELGRLGGVEETIFIRVGGHEIKAVPEADLDRTSAAGKASSVQFVHFPFTPEAIAAFRAPGAEAVAGIGHENYNHMAVMPEAVRAALSEDFA